MKYLFAVMMLLFANTVAWGQCQADFDGDDVVNFNDFLVFTMQYGKTEASGCQKAQQSDCSDKDAQIAALQQEIVTLQAMLDSVLSRIAALQEDTAALQPGGKTGWKPEGDYKCHPGGLDLIVYADRVKISFSNWAPARGNIIARVFKDGNPVGGDREARDQYSPAPMWIANLEAGTKYEVRVFDHRCAGGQSYMSATFTTQK